MLSVACIGRATRRRVSSASADCALVATHLCFTLQAAARWAVLRLADWVEPLLRRESYLALLLERPAVHERLLGMLGAARGRRRFATDGRGRCCRRCLPSAAPHTAPGTAQRRTHPGSPGKRDQGKHCHQEALGSGLRLGHSHTRLASLLCTGPWEALKHNDAFGHYTCGGLCAPMFVRFL